MPYSLEEHIAECHRRAEEYRQLYESTTGEKRDTYWSTMHHLLLLANNLKRKLDGPHRPNRKRMKLKNESSG
jgi:hypothetical protein